MVSTDVHRSFGDAYLRASAAMRERFEARVVAASCWRDGVAAALADLAEHVLEDPETARLTVTDVRFGTRDMLRLCDEDRRRTLASLTRGWERHHAGAAPQLQLEFLAGAISHVVAGAIERDQLDELPERLGALVAFVGQDG